MKARNLCSTNRGRGVLYFLLTTLLLALAGMSSVGSVAHAQTPVDTQSDDPKSHWQGRYRTLRLRAMELEGVIERERELYADANRRNYRRGGVRHVHQQAMVAAEQELAEVEAELGSIQEEARRAGALPGWFYEVDAEFEDGEVVLGPKNDGAAEMAPADDGGRNPLYMDD